MKKHIGWLWRDGAYCGEKHGEYYLAADVDAAFEACKAALSEAEAVLGGEYDMHHGPLFERIEKARSLMDSVTK